MTRRNRRNRRGKRQPTPSVEPAGLSDIDLRGNTDTLLTMFAATLPTQSISAVADTVLGMERILQALPAELRKTVAYQAAELMRATAMKPLQAMEEAATEAIVASAMSASGMSYGDAQAIITRLRQSTGFWIPEAVQRILQSRQSAPVEPTMEDIAAAFPVIMDVSVSRDLTAGTAAYTFTPKEPGA